jgi:hypothetical protein
LSRPNFGASSKSRDPMGALLDAVVHGLRAMGRTGCRAWPISRSGPRHCETALWPAGTFARAYAADRRATIETIIKADPVATCMRAIMVDRTSWTGSASALLRLCAQSAGDDISRDTAWAKNPRVLAGRLRRAQTILRTLGIEIAFSREGGTGARMIRASTGAENTVGTISIVSSVHHNALRGMETFLLRQKSRHQSRRRC